MIINGNDVAEVVVGSQQANGSDLFPVPAFSHTGTNFDHPESEPSVFTEQANRNFTHILVKSGFPEKLPSIGCFL